MFQAKATINNLDVLTGTNQSYDGYLNYNYLAIKAGLFIGGGRKKITIRESGASK